MKKLVLSLSTILCLTGCTSFVTAVGNNKVATTVTQRVFGVNIVTASANNQTPSIQLGLITTTVQFMPLSTNGPISSPNTSANFGLENNASPFTFDGDESMAWGNYASFALNGSTNSVLVAQPQNNK